MKIKMLFSTVLIACFVAVGCSDDSNPAAPTGPTPDLPTIFSMASVKIQGSSTMRTLRSWKFSSEIKASSRAKISSVFFLKHLEFP